MQDVNAPAADLWSLFKTKGFNEVDLATPLGAHSTSNQFNFDISPANNGKPQDSTPGIWDVKYYSDTLNPPNNAVVFPSDAKLAKFGQVGKELQGFVSNPSKWNGKFADAMGKMTFRSAGTDGLTDCTDLLP